MDLAPYLERLEAAIDPEHAAAVQKLQEDAVSYREVDRLPAIFGEVPKDWQTFPRSEAFYDPAKMLVNELAGVLAGALARDDRIYAIRANYGVGGVASIFGCKTRLVDEQMPYAEPLSEQELDAVLERDIPDITTGLGGRVLETEEFYLRALAPYPKLSSWVHIFVSDTQGPFDAAHLIMGHRIYTDLYDNPQRVHRLLEMVSEVIIRFTRAQKALIGEGYDRHYHGPFRPRGGIRVCEDSCTNISTESYLEFEIGRAHV